MAELASDDNLRLTLVRVAGRLLPGVRAPVAPTSLEGSDALVHMAARERLTGSLLAAVEAGDLSLPESSMETLVTTHRRDLSWCLHLEARLLEVRHWLWTEAGIDPVVVKGPAIAHLDEPGPELRTFVDLDLLVPAGDVDQAVAVLARRGAIRPWAQRRPGHDRRFAKSVTLTFPDGIEVDLHRSLCDGVHGFRIPLEQLFEETDRFAVGGQSFAALRPGHRLLHSAYHAILGSPVPKLMSLRDLANYLVRPDLTVEAVTAEASAWRGQAVLAEAVSTTLRTFEMETQPWSAWLASVTIEAGERHIVARQRAEGSSYGWGKVVALGELPAFTDRLRGGAGVIFPSRDHLRSRGLKRWEMFRASHPTTRSGGLLLPDLAQQREPTDGKGVRVLLLDPSPWMAGAGSLSIDGVTALDATHRCDLHLVVGSHGPDARAELARRGVQATVTDLQMQPGRRAYLGAARAAGREVRRFDAQVLQVPNGSLWMVATGLVSRRRRGVLIVADPDPLGPGGRVPFGRVEAIIAWLASRRHRVESVPADAGDRVRYDALRRLGDPHGA